MKKAIFIGAIGCGKTTLIQRLDKLKLTYNKTQTLEFYSNIIDTPGEYVEHRAMYSNLMTSAIDADVVVLMQSATDPRVVLPTGFSTMFTKPTVGIVTKIDVATPKQINLVNDRLKDAGASQVFQVSAVTGKNVAKFTKYLQS
ncbi:ethanolamine utilization protein EutP [Lentilactobacillus fungorum]|uniref:Ethanolamine utilization protein EutP n=1 Tax=Lentilactobacillus fungorum TaxID=2201250 RepID=A0ABQ3W0Z6_9LACO|nr:EutP/PduV family microcompartment system protein [Lentilactobacillus fungorum]GHP13344.1 ethanolamine utilization protein EutP [Lentilactobacillus fungorum]